MFLKEKHNFWDTVTFRLTLWYAVLFGILSIAGFSLVYVKFSSSLRNQVDSELKNSIVEFKNIYAQEGLNGLQEEFNRESEANGKSRVFFRLRSSKGNSLAASDLSEWLPIKGFSAFPHSLNESQESFVTIHVPKKHYNIRIANKFIQDGNWLQVGQVMSLNEKFLAEYRKVFTTILPILILCGIGVGILMARRAMSGVQKVAKIAVQVGTGNLDLRVSVKNEGQEIKELAYSFNNMLEKIQLLVREMKDVTNNIAHDLRSPLTRIRGLAESTRLADENIDAYREMAGVVVEESDKLVEMINTMLEIAQTESGVLELSKSPVDLYEIIGNAQDLFLPIAEEKSISLVFKKLSGQVMIMGDKTRLQRVIANMIDNAIKYSPPKSNVLISIEKDDSHIKIIIADNGIGIEEKEIDAIFKRFYREDSSRTTPGNGLGLSLALAIVRAHGGNIQVKSHPGQGTTFSIIFPQESFV